MITKFGESIKKGDIVYVIDSYVGRDEIHYWLTQVKVLKIQKRPKTYYRRNEDIAMEATERKTIRSFSKDYILYDEKPSGIIIKKQNNSIKRYTGYYYEKNRKVFFKNKEEAIRVYTQRIKKLFMNHKTIIWIFNIDQELKARIELMGFNNFA